MSPRVQLGNNQMETLQSYVRDLGGGLVAVGGPTSYGVGGYYGTPLEDTLPVDMQIKDEKRRPSLDIVFIIDHSGSMGETSGGVTKLELAKEAAARSIELLFPNDRVGVIAFDDTASWVVPMTDLQNPEDVANAIGGIQIGGGTDIYAGLLAMSKVLPNDPAKVKHVILLTDGGADITGIPELVEKLYKENGITLSTVGVGNDAAPFLKDLAALGGGRYHFTNNASTHRNHLHRRNHARLTRIHRRRIILSKARQFIAHPHGHHRNAAPAWLHCIQRQRPRAGDTRIRKGRSHPRRLAIRLGQIRCIHLRRNRSLGARLGALGNLPDLLDTSRALHHQRLAQLRTANDGRAAR